MKKNPKKKATQININQKMISFVMKNGIKIYPYQDEETKEWFIQINNNGKIRTSKNKIGSGSILSSEKSGPALKSAYEHYYNLLKQK